MLKHNPNKRFTRSEILLLLEDTNIYMDKLDELYDKGRKYNLTHTQELNDKNLVLELRNVLISLLNDKKIDKNYEKNLIDYAKVINEKILFCYKDLFNS